MNIELCKDNCCGCSACYASCPTNAIAMIEDKNGFMYPKIDKDKCVDCGLCVKKCPVADNKQHISIDAYYGWNNHLETRLKSSSGGVFSALAEHVLGSGGVVYGAVFNSETRFVEYRSTEDVDLDDIRRSKYTECYVGDVFKNIKANLQSGKTVLFCGTPCHVAGLVDFLGKNYSNLITCDFVCGGAASPAFFRAHLEYLERKYRGTISKVNFRDKKYGWKRMLFTAHFQNGRKKSTLSYFDSYFNGFIEGIIKRQNCFTCKFADNHYSDLTIADYWGYLKAGVPYDKNGISMIVVNTDQGKSIVDAIKSSCILTQMGLERTRYTIQPRQLNKEKLEKRNRFFEIAEKMGFENAAKKTYMTNPVKELLMSKLKK